jgi:hypothetical protein
LVTLDSGGIYNKLITDVYLYCFQLNDIKKTGVIDARVAEAR